MDRRTAPLLMVAIALLFSCQTDSQPKKEPAKGTIRGIVRDKDSGSPVGGATVKVGEVTGLTTPEGTYELSAVYGTYHVEVKNKGYEPYRSGAEVKIPPDGAASHDVEIRIEDKKAPEFESLSLRKVAVSSAELAFATDEPAKGRVEYGMSSDYGEVKGTSGFERKHVIRLEGLEAGKTYQYKLIVEDQRGNRSEPRKGKFKTLRPKDTKAPTTRLTKVPEPVTKLKNVGFAWTATDDRSLPERITYSFYLEGVDRTYSPFVSNTTRIYRGLKDGKYTFRIRAKDEDGNVEPGSIEYAFEVDALPPVNPSVLPAKGGKYVGSRAMELVLTAEGANEVALWEGQEPPNLVWTPFRSRKQLALTAGDGEKLVFARFRDKAGNLSETVSCSVILDTEPPSRPSGLKADPLSAAEVRLSWNPSKDKGSGIATYTVYRDGIEIGRARTTSFVDRQGRLGRRYSYSVAAVDKLKRASEPSTDVIVTIKGKSPLKPSLPNPPDRSQSQPTGLTLTWRGGDPDRGDAVTYDLFFGRDPSPPMRASSLKSPSFPLSGLAPAQKYYWKVVARDLQGMETQGTLWTFTTAKRSNTAPIAMVSVRPSSGPARTEFSFNASRSQDKEDPASALSFCWDWDDDGKPDTPWRRDNRYDKTMLKIGTHKVWVHVKDSLGASSRASITVEVLNSPPRMGSEPMPQNGATGEPMDVKLTWNFVDNDPKDKLTYDIYFGTASGKLKAVARGLKTASYKPKKELKPGHVYYWRVEVKDSNGAKVQSPLWSFATARRAVRTPLRAEGTVHPPKGKTTTPFRFDAAGCRDPDDPSDALRVRWDWNGDGKFDTPWSKTRQAVKTFSKIGNLRVGLEVINTLGKTAKTAITVVVENTPPAFVGRSAPKNGATGVEADAALDWTVNDPDPGEKVTFTLYLGLASGGGMGLAKSAFTETRFKPEKPFKHGEVYNWRVVAQDEHGAKVQTPIWTFSVKKKENNAPFRPITIEGKTKIHLGDRSAFKTRSKDRDEDPIQIRFDWGDGTISPWAEVNSQGWVELTHLFAKTGNYGIKAQAMDSNFAKSDWSEVHFVTVVAALKPGEEPEDLWHWDPEVIQSTADLFTLKIKYWFANFGGWGQWKGVGNPLADLDFRSDLGISERKGAPWAFFEFGKHFSGGMEYYFLEYTGATTFGQDSSFGGFLFPAGSDVDTTSSVRFGWIFSGFSPYLGTYAGGGIRIGAGYFWARTTIKPSAGGERQVETVETPLPLVGLYLYGRITKYFMVKFEAAYIEGNLQEFHVARGKLLDLSGELLFTPVPFVGLALGYKYTIVDMRITEEGGTDTAISLQLDGIHLAIRVHF